MSKEQAERAHPPLRSPRPLPLFTSLLIFLLALVSGCGGRSTDGSEPLMPDAAKGATSEIEILKMMPEGALRRIAGTGRPDSAGLVGHNREGWLHVGLQRGAMVYLALNAVRGDSARVEEAWRAIEASFERQLPDGGFETGTRDGKSPSRVDDLSGVSFWLAKLCHALLVLRDSDIGPDYDQRIEELLPGIRLAADWLERGRAELAEYDSEAANRLFFDAAAFGFSGLLLEDPELQSVGREFAEMGLATQRADGVFREHGGHDSSYQAVALLMLQLYALRFPSDDLWAAARSAAHWEIGRVKETGEVNVSGNTRTGLGQEAFLGTAKQVDYIHVVLALFYYAAYANDREAYAAASRAYKYASRMQSGDGD
jgi:hypothetical protein